MEYSKVIHGVARLLIFTSLWFQVKANNMIHIAYRSITFHKIKQLLSNFGYVITQGFSLVIPFKIKSQ